VEATFELQHRWPANVLAAWTPTCTPSAVRRPSLGDRQGDRWKPAHIREKDVNGVYCTCCAKLRSASSASLPADRTGRQGQRPV
jgi:hypothetical protein